MVLRVRVRDASAGFRTFFDSVTLTVFKAAAAVIVQENHYYPFGQNMVGIEELDQQSLSSQEEQKFQYNAKEKLDEFQLYWNDHGARNLDLQTLRWTSVDPLAEKYAPMSPYVGLGNNPVVFVDPDGRDIINIALSIQADKQDQFNTQDAAFKEKYNGNRSMTKDDFSNKADFKAYKEARNDLGTAEKLLETATLDAKHVTQALANFAAVDPEAYEELNSLTFVDSEGTTRPMHIFVGGDVKGIAAAHGGGATQPRGDGITEKGFASNTSIRIYLTRTHSPDSDVLAHEFGHVKGWIQDPIGTRDDRINGAVCGEYKYRDNISVRPANKQAEQYRKLKHERDKKLGN